jgi:catechol 2,3-dioxygenase-like lactoylglutathione lyase family enzyme
MSDASIFDHMMLRVSNYERSKSFYVNVLKPLGVTLLMEFPRASSNSAGFGRGMPTLWLEDSEKAPQKAHVAFMAASRAMVDAFYEAALAAGASDNGPPGLRPHYHANYYAAFVRDPDGHNIEAVTHASPGAKAAAKRSAKGKATKARTAKGKAKARPAAKKAKAKAPARRKASRKPARGAKRGRR